MDPGRSKPLTPEEEEELKRTMHATYDACVGNTPTHMMIPPFDHHQRGDTRYLVCEGKCNPTLSEYDLVVSRAGFVNGVVGRARNLALGNVVEFARSLIHTRHERTITPACAVRSPVWRNGSWFREFRCAVCGTLKLF